MYVDTVDGPTPGAVGSACVVGPQRVGGKGVSTMRDEVVESSTLLIGSAWLCGPTWVRERVDRRVGVPATGGLR
jgi:hypothetical protein